MKLLACNGIRHHSAVRSTVVEDPRASCELAGGMADYSVESESTK